jgi:hypothetical protein
VREGRKDELLSCIKVYFYQTAMYTERELHWDTPLIAANKHKQGKFSLPLSISFACFAVASLILRFLASLSFFFHSV